MSKTSESASRPVVDDIALRLKSLVARQPVFEPEGHRYYIEHFGQRVYLPSVSEIIAPLGGYEGADPIMLQQAAQRGTDIHSAIMMHQQYRWPYDEVAAPHIANWEAFLKEADLEPVAMEVMLYSPAYMYAGTIDCIARSPDGLLHIVDIKTGTAMLDLKFWSQVNLYQMMLDEILGCKGPIHVGHSYIVMTGLGQWTKAAMDYATSAALVRLHRVKAQSEGFLWKTLSKS